LQAFPQQFSANEFTVGAAFQTYAWGNGQGCLLDAGASCLHSVSPGPSFTYSRNLSPILALEGTYQPTSAYFMQNGLFDSGRMALALGGVKSGWRGRRWGLYGKLQAGVASFSCATWNDEINANQQLSGWNHCGRLTHFALEYGGVVEYHKSPRYDIRLDAGHLMIAEFDRNLLPARFVSGYDLNARWGNVLNHFDMRLGITRSFGRQETITFELAPEKQKWDTGIVFALQPRTEPWYTNGFLNPYPEWGVWASWNMSKYFSWDTTLLHSPRNPGLTVNPAYQAGGRAFEALSGVKVGFRSGHMGYFAKVRPGIITFGETYRQRDDIYCGQQVCGAKIDEGMFTDAVLDTGGIIEAYPSRHTILRFDAGSATIFYLPKNIVNSGISEPIPSSAHPSILVSVGAGFRF